MPPLTLKAKAISLYNSTTVKCESRGFTFTLQQSEENPEKNYAMNPMEALLCALGGCQVITTINYAKKHNIDLEGVSVELEGEFDTDGILGIKDVRSGYSGISCRLLLDTNESSRKIDSLIKTLQEKAPVVDTINNPVKLQIEAVTMSKH
ncbi:OsmC family protein [Clostridium sp. CX1]|uniref:OsmC family protein n=1 Tax=Clostridium tanneri TaxID=3037988 RepID=A0ABU4JS41_9CLOT|nr:MULTISPECIES: OsmC family protein [unclassified Clostridium]MCT8978113.1 OsmC family protein [Clostridium sp. CX1]MDW8800964.1 OsmC family protein [Clostridium sp. A1-XYC3]